MLAFKRSILMALVGLVLASTAPARADLWPMWGDSGDNWLSSNYSSYDGVLVPNMIGAESIGLGYDNQIVQARLTYQHFLRVADNNSPVPRDRVSFGYKFYSNVRTAEGAGALKANTDLQEFQLRAEKTFLDGDMSAEFILPWAYTTNSNDTGSLASPPDLNSELGNMGFGLKALLWDNDTSYFTAGLLVEVPTADDRVSLLGSRLENEEWYFSPYLAALVMANDKLFFQGFTNFRLGTDENDERGLGRAFTGPDMYMLDVGTGYLLIERDSGFLRGVTPTLELHYTHSLEEFEDGTTIGPYSNAIGRFDMLTLTAGTTFQLGDNSTLAGAFAVPLSDGDVFTPGVYEGPTESQYDWAFLLQYNWYFN